MLRQKITLTYKNIYDKDFDGKIETLFEGITEDYAFPLIDILNRNLDNYQTTNALLKYLGENWFSKENAKHYNLIADRVEDHARMKVFQDCEMLIFNAYSNLKFIEELIVYLKEHPGQVKERPSNQRMESNLIDAYLIVNQNLNRSDNGKDEIETDYPTEYSPWLFLYKPFQYADVINRDLLELYLTENAKAIMLLQYFADTPTLRPILDTFLDRYQCSTWNEYLQAISSMSVAGLNTANLKGNSLIALDPELPYYQVCLRVIDQISVAPIEANIQQDLLYLRTHPIHKTGENKYQILSQRFFIEKIFRALYFDFKTINNELGIMSEDQFRTKFYTSEFSESTVFNSVLEEIFRSASFTRDGTTMDMMAPQFGASDFIADHDQQIFLFESKDVLVNKNVKERLYIPEIRAEFRKRFYKDGNSDKAVLQLARNIKKILDGKYQLFGFAPGKYRHIYPIVVVHSDAFNILGINQILFQWFREACIEVGITKKKMYKVKQVTIVDISTLLYFQEALNKKGTGLGQIIDTYLSRTNLNPKKVNYSSAIRHGSKYMIPFTFFLNNFIKKKKRFRTPKKLIKYMQDYLLPKKN